METPSWKEHLDLIKKNIYGNIKKDDFEKFIYLAEKYQLDPLRNEIWATPQSGGHIVVVARQGLRSIALRSNQYDGMNTDVRRVDEPFELRNYDKKKRKWETVRFDFQYVGSTTVWRKDMNHPISPEEVWESEYSTGKSLWKTKRRTMTGKVAEAQALRAAFDISDIYIAEEMMQDSNTTEIKNESLKEQVEPKEEKKVESANHGDAVKRIEKARDKFTEFYHTLSGKDKQEFGAKMAELTKKYGDYAKDESKAAKLLEVYTEIAKEKGIK